MNLLQQDAHYETTTLRLLPWILLFLLPILTMRSLAGEARDGTLILLYTNASELWEIITGKFLAYLTLLGLALLITLIYPAVYEIYHYVHWGNILSAYLGLFLFSALYLSIGLWISSLTDEQSSAATLSLFAFLGLSLSGVLLPLLPQTLEASLITLTAFGLFLLWRAYRLHFPGLFLLAALGLAVFLLGAAWLYKPLFLIGLLGKIGNLVSPLFHYTGFTQGLIRFSDTVYFLSSSALFFVLSILRMEKRRWA